MSSETITQLQNIARELRPSRGISFLAYHTSNNDGVTVHNKYTVNTQVVGFVPPACPDKNAGLADQAPSWQDQEVRSGRLMFAIDYSDSIQRGDLIIRLAQIGVVDPRVLPGDYYRTTCGIPSAGLICKGDRVVVQYGNCRDPLGRVAQVFENGYIRVSSPAPYSAPGWIFQSSSGIWLRILTFLIYPAEYDYTPNVLIAEPTWVTAEHSIIPDQALDQAKVKAFIRMGPQGQPDWWFSAKLKTLPAKLDPGWYAFRSQDEIFGEDQDAGSVGEERNNFRQNGSIAPFTLGFERPRLLFDCLSQTYSHCYSSQIPDEEIIGRNALVQVEPSGEYRILCRCEGGISGGGGAIATNNLLVEGKHKQMLAPSWKLIARTYGIDGGKLSQHFSRQLEDVFGGYLIRAILKSPNGEVHFAETVLEPQWRNTGIEVMHVAPCDSDTLPPDYEGPGVLDLFAYSGYESIKPGSTIRLGNPQAADLGGDSYLVLDNNDGTPYYREIPIEGQPRYEAWTRISIFGADLAKRLVLNSFGYYTEEIVFDATLYEHKRISVLEGYSYRSRWKVWDGTKFHTVHECVMDTSEIPEGSELRYIRENLPRGEKYTVARRGDRLPFDQIQLVSEDGTALEQTALTGREIALVQLNHSDITGEVRVCLSNKHEFAVLEKELPPPQSLWQVPSDSGQVYLCRGLGEGRNEAWLVFHPSWANQEVWVNYTYWSEDLFISHFALAKNEVYACEAGNGQWLQYLPRTRSCQLISQVCAGGNGLMVAPSSNMEGDIWSVTSPEGQLAKFSTQHIGHVEEADFAEANFATAAGELAQSFDAVTFLEPNGEFYFLPRVKPAGAVRYLLPREILMPGPESVYQPGQEAVQVDYAHGSARTGKESRELRLNLPLIGSFAQAQLISRRLFYFRNREQLTVDCVFLPEIHLGSMVGIPGILLGRSSQGYVIGMVVGFTHDHKHQTTSLTLREESHQSDRMASVGL